MMFTLMMLAFAQTDGFPRRVEIDQSDAWPRSGRIVVEGVYTSLGEGAEGFRPMHLQKTNVTFNVPRALLREKAPTGNVDVTGVVESARGRLVVQVEKVELLPSDDLRFQEIFDSAGDQFEKYDQASNWARRRFELYKSPAMAAAAEKAARASLQVQRKLASGDPERLAALSSRIRQDARIKDYDLDALNHEIVRAEFDRVKPDDSAALLEFGDAVSKRLPGADERGDAVDPRYRRDYDSKPLVAYLAADAALRHALARYFYSTVIDKALTAGEKSGSAPFDLAQIAKQRIPEYREASRKWIRAWVKTQEGRLVELEGDATEETARTVEKELEDFSLGSKIRLEWLEAKETRIRQREREAAEEAGGKSRIQRDADGWFELANRRLSWFPKNPEHELKSVKILEDVLSFAPQYNKAEVEIRRLGYTQQTDGVWRRNADRAADQKGSAAKALSTNMTPAEVLGSLGKPTYQSRAATAAGATVVWIYQSTGRETLVVFTGPPDALRVSKIHAQKE